MDVGIADVDSDGDLDIISANPFGINIIRNRGRLRFLQPKILLENVKIEKGNMEIADFDNDGSPDILISGGDEPAIAPVTERDFG